MYSYVSQTWKNLEKKKDRKIGNIRKIVFLENENIQKLMIKIDLFNSQVVWLIKQFSPKRQKMPKRPKDWRCLNKGETSINNYEFFIIKCEKRQKWEIWPNSRNFSTKYSIEILGQNRNFCQNRNFRQNRNFGQKRIFI